MYRLLGYLIIAVTLGGILSFAQTMAVVNGASFNPRGPIAPGSTLWRSGPFSVTTEGESTHLSIYVTGLDLTTEPAIHIGGVPVEVTWYGKAPGFAGLQQINVKLPAQMAGVGMVPITVTSGGKTSNVTFMNILPTTEMMQGMPGWNSGRMVGKNMGRVREMSDLAYIVSNHNALVSDEGDDALRVISMESFETLRNITLPDGSEASAVAVNAEGTMAGAALSHNASVAQPAKYR